MGTWQRPYAGVRLGESDVPGPFGKGIFFRCFRKWVLQVRHWANTPYIFFTVLGRSNDDVLKDYQLRDVWSISRLHQVAGLSSIDLGNVGLPISF